MKEDDRTYEEMREDAKLAYSRIFKDSLAFDMAYIPKDVRIKLVDDEQYVLHTKATKASLYADQLKKIKEVIDLRYSNTDKSAAPEILKALEMRNKLLFNDLNIEADDSNALNITFLALNREDFNKSETIEVFKGDSNHDDNVSLDNDEPELPTEVLKEKAKQAKEASKKKSAYIIRDKKEDKEEDIEW